jgi:hypothetical protein
MCQPRLRTGKGEEEFGIAKLIISPCFSIVSQVNNSNLWTQKRFEETDYWFLKTERAVEALEDLTGGITPLEEVCIVSMPRIIVTIEAGKSGVHSDLGSTGLKLLLVF